MGRLIVAHHLPIHNAHHLSPPLPHLLDALDPRRAPHGGGGKDQVLARRIYLFAASRAASKICAGGGGFVGQDGHPGLDPE